MVLKERGIREIGPIRPPSEAQSILLRVTRNCPWNRCRFCGLYKGMDFSIRSLDEIKNDLKIIKEQIVVEESNSNRKYDLFLQDANALVVPTEDLIEILRAVKKELPMVERITSYARSATIVKKGEEQLLKLRKEGLDRIHIGVETGNDAVLQLVQKGATKEIHMTAGKLVKGSGIELSVYYMPGLGGTEYAEDSARDTSEVVNAMNPDYLRIRTLAVPEDVPLRLDYEKGVFVRSHDDDMVQELLDMLHGVNIGDCQVVSDDHILNLIPEATGWLPDQKSEIISKLEEYINLEENKKTIYKVGRRLGWFYSIDDLEKVELRKAVESVIEEKQISTKNVDLYCEQMMKLYI